MLGKVLKVKDCNKLLLKGEWLGCFKEQLHKMGLRRQVAGSGSRSHILSVINGIFLPTQQILPGV